MAPWHEAAKRNDASEMQRLILKHRGTMLHAWNSSVCASCSSRSPDHGRHWGSCHRLQCANYGSRWNGNTALHDAATAGYVDIIRLLIDCGANVSATNKRGKTPADMTSSVVVRELLRTHAGIRGVDATLDEPSESRTRQRSTRLNASTLSGAIDIVAVRQADGSLKSSTMHVRFGKLLVPFASGRRVEVLVNQRTTTFSFELGSEGEAAHSPSSEELAQLRLEAGVNYVDYQCDGCRPVVARLFLLQPWDRLVITDVDGTITRSDLRGHLPSRLAQLLGRDQRDVCALLTAISGTGHVPLYLTARPIGFAAATLQLLATAKEGDLTLPLGPLILSPTRTLDSLNREVLKRVPHAFKIRALKELRDLWPDNPFVGALGNKPTDTEAYQAVGVPLSRIFIVDPTGKLMCPDASAAKEVTSYMELCSRVPAWFPHVQPSTEALAQLALRQLPLGSPSSLVPATTLSLACQATGGSVIRCRIGQPSSEQQQAGRLVTVTLNVDETVD